MKYHLMSVKQQSFRILAISRAHKTGPRVKNVPTRPTATAGALSGDEASELCRSELTASLSISGCFGMQLQVDESNRTSQGVIQALEKIRTQQKKVNKILTTLSQQQQEETIASQLV